MAAAAMSEENPDDQEPEKGGGQTATGRRVVWVLLLPWMAGLAIWESSRVLWVKLTMIAGLAAATLYMFLPRAA